jgi:hypothetical protein
MADAEKLLTGEQIEALPIKERVNYRYQHAQGTIQDLARVYRLEVNDVLDMLNLNDLSEIQTQGDLIDQAEAGPEVRVNPQGNPARSQYTTN